MRSPKDFFAPLAVGAPSWSGDDGAHARRVVAAMGDGTGAVIPGGRMEDDASLKQRAVLLYLADRLAALDPEPASTYAAEAGS